MTNEQLVIRIKAGENADDNMEMLYSQVRSFIHAMAWKYRGSGEVDDLEQEGYLALYPAIAGYDPDQKVKFLTYAEYWIRLYMKRYLQTNGSCLRLPVNCQEKVRQYEKFCTDFAEREGRNPLEWETAAYLGLNTDQVEDIKKNACLIKLGSLDSPIHGLEEDGTTIAEAVADPADLENDVLDRLGREQISTVLWGCVDRLDGSQPEVIRKRYQGRRSLESIGADYGITREAVSRIERKALQELGKPQYAARLLPFLEIYGMALSGNGSARFQTTWTSSTERAALYEIDWEARQREHLEWLESYRNRRERL